MQPTPAGKPVGDRNEAFEARADALARLWLDRSRPPAQLQPLADALIADAPEPERAALAALSTTYGAMQLAMYNPPDPAVRARTDAVLQQVQDCPWPGVQAVAQAACGFAYVYDRERITRTLPQLMRARDEPLLPIDRLCVEFTIATACLGLGRFDEALQLGVRSCHQARSVGLAYVGQMAESCLGVTALCVGDVESAIERIEPIEQARQRSGQPSLPGHYNLLLALAVAGLFDDARRLLQERSWIESPQTLQRMPTFAPLLAYIHASLGQVETAENWLAYPQPAPKVRIWQVEANAAWLTAAVHLQHGRSAQATRLLQTFLDEAAAAGQTEIALTPMNGTQVHRLLSQALEAAGDLRGALDQLKRSQTYCSAWVGQSVKARLQMLHLEVAQKLGEPAAAQQQRVRAMQDAVQSLGGPDAAAAAEAATRQLRWMAHVTHEVRNPVAGVVMMTSLLAMSDLDEQQRRFAGLAHSSAQMVLALCNDLLDLAKIDAGRFELHAQSTDVAALLQECAATFAPQTAMRGVSLSCDLDPGIPPALHCDPLRLRQVLMNLLGNAGKFTTAGSITLTARWQANPDTAQGTLQVAVQDTGPGIAPEVLARLFREFEQGDASVAQAHGGTGLGLALCRSLIGLMGGQIAAQSTPGVGSRFWFDLPLRCEEAPAASPPQLPAPRSTRRPAATARRRVTGR